MEREENAPGAVGELRSKDWRPGLEAETASEWKTWLVRRLILADSGPTRTLRLAVAGEAAVAGEPALVRKKVLPPRAWKVELGAWFWGPMM